MCVPGLALVGGDCGLKAEFASVYPEATPVGALPSVLAYA
jgi:hypothetical protein